MTNKLFFIATLLLTLGTGGVSLNQYSASPLAEYELSRESTRLLANIEGDSAFSDSKRRVEEVLSCDEAGGFVETRVAFIQLVQARDWWKIEKSGARRATFETMISTFVDALDRDLRQAEGNALKRRETTFWLGFSSIFSILGMGVSIVISSLQRFKIRKAIRKLWLDPQNLSLPSQVEAVVGYCLRLEARR